MRYYRLSAIVILLLLILAVVLPVGGNFKSGAVMADDGGGIPILPISQNVTPSDSTYSDTLSSSGATTGGEETSILADMILMIVSLIY